MILHLILRDKWKTPCHSKNKSKDDTHEVKEDILKEVSKLFKGKKHVGKVGKNPDLDINEDDIIILKGVGQRKGNEFNTNISAAKFFVLAFTCTSKTFEIELYFAEAHADERPDIYDIRFFGKHELCLYVIPNEPGILQELLNYLINIKGIRKVHSGSHLRFDNRNQKAI